MSQIQESIDVHVPVRTAYNQWTMFEEFPRFMEGVERVEQRGDTHMHWVAQIAGQRREWDAEVTEQVPDERVAWTSTTGARNAGVVTFHHLAPDETRVMLQLDFEPDGPVESVGDALGMVKMRVKGDLERFRDYIESRGEETGAWRGEVPQGGRAGGMGESGMGTGATGGMLGEGTGMGADPLLDPGLGSGLGTEGGMGGTGMGAGEGIGEGVDDGLGGTFADPGEDLGGGDGVPR